MHGESQAGQGSAVWAGCCRIKDTTPPCRRAPAPREGSRRAANRVWERPSDAGQAAAQQEPHAPPVKQNRRGPPWHPARTAERVDSGATPRAARRADALPTGFGNAPQTPGKPHPHSIALPQRFRQAAPPPRELVMIISRNPPQKQGKPMNFLRQNPPESRRKNRNPAPFAPVPRRPRPAPTEPGAITRHVPGLRGAKTHS